jgi:Ca2+-binding EF-hand superfamily protein
MFDGGSGTIDIYGFERLYNYVNQWLGVFKGYDTDQSGSIQENELSNGNFAFILRVITRIDNFLVKISALNQMGYRFTPEFIRFLVAKSDPARKIEVSVDQFIVLCIQIQKFTEAFRGRDMEQKGVITIGFEDFLTVALSCT